MSDSCGSCKFFYEDHCRRYPPTQHVLHVPVYAEELTFLTQLPLVEDTEWCGEFKQVEKSDDGK